MRGTLRSTIPLLTVLLAGACSTVGGEATPGSVSSSLAVPLGPSLPSIDESPRGEGPLIGDATGEPVFLHDYYEVEGDTLDDVLRSMEERHPGGHNAYTTWHVGWKYEFVSRPLACELSSFWTVVQARYTLPRLVRDPLQSPALLEEWERYVGALRVHEEQHAAFGQEAAREMERLVAERYTRGTNREGLRAAIDQACRTILDETRERERAYDERTDHGRTQGAWLAGSIGRDSAPAAGER